MKKKYTIVGIDEAGRGPLAGPVVAASVVVDEKYLPKEIDDSKKVSEKNRNAFYEVIIKNAAEYGIGIVDSEEIDKINIHNATLEAMKRAYNNIKKDEYKVYIDGIFDLFHYGHIESFRKCKELSENVTLIVGVISDKNATSYKRPPIYCESHRYALVENSKYVDQIVQDPPLVVTKEFMEKYNVRVF